MIAAQKLRDFAISYGAECTTMIMVISVADLFNQSHARSRQATQDPLETDMFTARKRLRKDEIVNKDLSRLEDQVSPPLAIGHVALVFTDICNSTHLWEVNAGMETAMLHFPTENDKQYPHCRASCAGFGPSSLPPPCSFQNTFLPSYFLAPALDPSYQCVFPKVPGQTWLDMYT